MFKCFSALLAALLLAAPAHASVVIGGTRVIYPAQAPEVTVQLLNRDPQPALLQVWIDDGDAQADPNTLKVPFIVSPVMVRIEAEKGQALRVMHTGESMPADRESLFWLNVLQVPPRADAAGNSLQMAIRTRIKLLYRPQGLAGQASEAPATVIWSTGRSDGQWFVQARNPGPYFVNLGAVRLLAGGRQLEAGAGHVPPFGQARFPINDAPGQDAAARVNFIALDDYGAGRPGEAQVAVP
ncbi:fimbria/pilus periplasmic chaperone [Pseudomonas sp. TE3610]